MMLRMSERPMRTPEVARMLGVSFRQLDYWCRVGFIPAAESPGSGRQRSWTTEQVRAAEELAVVFQLWSDGGIQRNKPTSGGALLTLVRNLRAMGLDPLELAGVKADAEATPRSA
jgi:hypothetical protein